MHGERDDERSDVELLALAQAGDVAAFESLYLRHRDFVYRVAVRFAGNHAAAMDVSQEAFAYLLRKLPGLRLSGRLSTYLYPVVKHIALAGRRRSLLGRRKIEERAFMLGSTSGPGNPGESGLLDAVDALPEPQREVLVMRIVDGMSVEEVAAALGVPAGTVKSRLFHALAALRERVKLD